MPATKAQCGQRGYTVIELVVVIAILGIVAAFAIPRLALLEVEERKAATEALAASVRSRAALVHALWLRTEVGTVSLEGADVAIVNGYPTIESIEHAPTSAPGFRFAGGVWTARDATTPSGCAVTYRPPSGPGLAPQVIAVTAGC